MTIDLRCFACNKDLIVERTQNRYGDDFILEVRPCEQCLKDEREEALEEVE
jgi:hypothetical protein